jgi:hypothetical protein
MVVSYIFEVRQIEGFGMSDMLVADGTKVGGRVSCKEKVYDM